MTKVPFPALTELELQCVNGQALFELVISDIPDTFLGGSAPCLRYLSMDCTPFPGIRNLLLSATHLVDLRLTEIPHSGYISPEAMVTCLFVLTSLEGLVLEFQFQSSRQHPDRESRRPPPRSRSILPYLKSFSFKGASEYLEDLVAWIDAPRLDRLSITFLHQTDSDTSYLFQFIGRTPGFEEPNEARVLLGLDAQVQLLWASDNFGSSRLLVKISCELTHPQVSSVAQVCTLRLPSLPTVENLHLDVFYEDRFLNWKDNIEEGRLLDLLRPFTAVKSLYLSEELHEEMSYTLQELVGNRTMEVLPSLQNIFLGKFEQSEPFQEDIKEFVAARQLSGHPIAFFPLQNCTIDDSSSAGVDVGLQLYDFS